MTMDYKVGDKVQIKSLEWYNKNKDSDGNVVFSSKVPHFSWCENVRTAFTKDMVKFCGKVVTIETVWTANYSIVEGTNRDYFTDEMIEGIVEDTTIKIKDLRKFINQMEIEGLNDETVLTFETKRSSGCIENITTMEYSPTTNILIFS